MTFKDVTSCQDAGCRKATWLDMACTEGHAPPKGADTCSVPSQFCMLGPPGMPYCRLLLRSPQFAANVWAGLGGYISRQTELAPAQSKEEKNAHVV